MTPSKAIKPLLALAGLVLGVVIASQLATMAAPAYQSGGTITAHGHRSNTDGGLLSTVPLLGVLNSSGTQTNTFIGPVAFGYSAAQPSAASEANFSIDASSGIKTSSAVVIGGMATAPNGIASKGVIYYDTAAQTLKTINNNGAATAIPDPPGVWTCTIRQGTAANIAATGTTVTVSCTGNEKAISGGCLMTGAQSSSAGLTSSGPSSGSQGWTCYADIASASGKQVNAFANCCL